MNTYKAALIKRILRTPTIESFRFTVAERLAFMPGQFLQVIFNEGRLDDKELNKYLSFSSSPEKPYVEFTKRLSASSFSDHLRALTVGDVITVSAPFGANVFKDEYKKIAFLIGGIGITPVISILEHIAEKNMPTDAQLFYSNRNEEEIAFKKELDGWQAAHPHIKVWYTVTDCAPKDPTYAFGRLEKSFLEKHIHDWRERVIFSFGPPQMVGSMKQICADMGCSLERVKTENFVGY